MHFFSLMTPDRKLEIMFWQVYYKKDGVSEWSVLRYDVPILLKDTYTYAKHIDNKLGEKKSYCFIEDLNSLKYKLIDFIESNIKSNKIRKYLTKQESKNYQEMYKDLQIIYNYFLPLQKDFAKKWSLEVIAE